MESAPSPVVRPHRGTIIVDASTLIFLGAEVAPHLRADGLHPTDYLEVLRFLGRNGYRILIPEVVSLESAQVLATGQSLGNYFDSERKLTQKSLKSFLHDAALPEGDPLKSNPNVQIVAHTGPAHVDRYCADMGNAVNHSTLRFTGRNTRTVTANQQKRTHLVKLMERDRTDFGDDAILSLLEREGSGNVAVLANDTGLLRRVNREFPDVHTSNSVQLLYAMGRAGLNRSLGFAPQVRSRDIRDDHIAKTRATGSEGDAYSLKYDAFSNDGLPFYLSLRALGDELRAHQLKSEVPPPAAGARAAKFADKYARFKGMQPPKTTDGQGR
jgi:hypothetical protein